jgi:hypothetical protein
MPDDGDLGKRLDAIKRLLDLFKFERMVYMGVTVLSLLMAIKAVPDATAGRQ